MFDFTVWAFNLSEQYRLPVIILADEVVGHMTEKVVIPPEDQIKVLSRPKPTVPPDQFLPYKPGPDGVAPMANFGDGYRIHVTGLTHDERGYPVMDEKAQSQMITRIVNKIKNNVDRIIRYEAVDLDDADVAVVAYGISARSARRAVREARAKGIRAGLLKLNTVWPFPEALINDLAGKVKAMVMPEINMGQMVLELERCSRGKCAVHLVAHPGGSILSPRKVLAAIEAALEEGE
jgi:2-oxoglutarate ferredoxin oxidoreductase subunit alpha